MRSDGRSRPTHWQRQLHAARFRLREALAVPVEVVDGDRTYRFLCDNTRVLRRAKTLFVKEAGTIAWLRRTLRPGDCFLDVGANIGLYTIFGASLVGQSGRVYAVEPHVPTAHSLFANLVANDFTDRVRVLTIALGDAPGFGRFEYNEWGAGSSQSQFAAGQRAVVAGAVGVELKFATSVDDLIARGVVGRPAAIKIDVDGIEPAILVGMRGLLANEGRPRSVQVEIQPETQAQIFAFFDGLPYRFDHRHFTMAGEKYRARGVREADIAHNIVFQALEGRS